MTNKKSIVYYTDIMHPNSNHVLGIYDSGKQAVKVVQSEARNFFQMPAILKGQQTIPKDGRYTLGFSFRHLTARHLTDGEVKTYAKYGDRTLILWDTETLAAPDLVEEDQQ